MRPFQIVLLTSSCGAGRRELRRFVGGKDFLQIMKVEQCIKYYRFVTQYGNRGVGYPQTILGKPYISLNREKYCRDYTVYRGTCRTLSCIDILEGISKE